MKKLLLILLITLTLSAIVSAQSNAKRPPLPPNVAKMKGEYPDKLLKISAVKSRMKTLLGKNYEDFFDSFETNRQFERKGNFLFSHGCLIHACTHLESAIAVDLVNKTIHIGIFRENEPVKTFNENGRKTPKLLANWASNLTNLSKH